MSPKTQELSGSLTLSGARASLRRLGGRRGGPPEAPPREVGGGGGSLPTSPEGRCPWWEGGLPRGCTHLLPLLFLPTGDAIGRPTPPPLPGLGVPGTWEEEPVTIPANVLVTPAPPGARSQPCKGQPPEPIPGLSAR